MKRVDFWKISIGIGADCQVLIEADFLFTLKGHHAKLSQTGQSACAILLRSRHVEHLTEPGSS
jgi:hypothetical protein